MPTAVESWALWRTIMDVPAARAGAIRRTVSRRIGEDRPNLEELGSSDLNGYAVSYIESGALVIKDGQPHWTDLFPEDAERLAFPAAGA